ncbi:MAG TPA: hypothetical protein HA366_00920 [Candidatus Methanomethylophilaceae archaeon]|nr:hypothetical protein [Candidatus Methanomethylophilaceae archaeon]
MDKWKKGARSHGFNSKDEAVASVIGTIMALLVFMTVLSIIVTSYVPAWEKENEQAFMTDTVFRMSSLKSVNDQMNENDNDIHFFMPLAPDKVPIFGKTVIGNLSFEQSGGSTAKMLISFTDEEQRNCDFSCGGSLTYKIDQNTQLHQNVAYELGAVILAQEDGELMRVQPSIVYDTTSNGLIVQMINLAGDPLEVTGSGMAGITMNMTEKDNYTSNTSSLNRSVLMTIESSYPTAWYNWAISSFVQTGFIDMSDVTLTGNELTVRFSDIDRVRINRSQITIELG